MEVGYVLQLPALEVSFYNQIFIQEHETIYNDRMKIKSDRPGDWNSYLTFFVHQNVQPYNFGREFSTSWNPQTALVKQ